MSTPTIATPGVDRVVVGVVGVSWVLAVLPLVWGRGPLPGHDELLADGGPPWPVAVLLFVAVWQLMTGAMMLPSSLPMVRLFGRVSAGQERAGLALAAFLAGYAAVWTGFAATAFAGDTALHRLVEGWPALRDRPWVILAATLLVAGGFQFSPLKERCLHECRSPASFLYRYYARGLGAAWRLGLRHGLFCLGCCWALMLVMFGVGVGSLPWMLALTGVMVVEKTSRHGRRLVPIVGTTLLVWGGLLVVRGLVLGSA